ncbi:ribosome biogenesis GTPase Der [Cysteiniphilum sp. JM-1]|uniref:ribosome biogenesis GTPase Der n=1 Tax=Cysteiniphilum sp. JM-1 TaxID=2610891 RepID=UPI001245EF7E|nr:ribosome biogenesis GTPase Der [Cysteiniphilum sp. JM-1]
MVPVIAIVGRPNVGKSTLFNALTRTRDALVYDMPGVTRDRQYGQAEFEEQPFIVIDTGGLSDNDAGVDGSMADQSILAIEEADLVYFVVDAQAGLTAGDLYIAELLRTRGKPSVLVINKTDGMQEEVAAADFYSLGFEALFPIAASHRRGVGNLLSNTLLPLCDKELNDSEHAEGEANKRGIRFALIGRPNVGKSTLTNRMLGEDRVVVYDMPGTTIDSVYIPFSRNDEDYTIIDTAGIRRKGKVRETLEKFSVVKTLQAIKDANVVIVLIDAKEGLTDQDMHLMGFALNAGRAMVIAVNKWDGMSASDRENLKEEINRRLVFLKDYVDIHFISALHGTNVGHLFASLKNAYRSATKRIPTPELTQVLKMATQDHVPPMSGKSRIKLKYAHMGGHNPPVIVIHGNQVNSLPGSYKRYLEKFFREAFNLVGTPISFEFKQSENPYEPTKQKKLTPLQRYRDKQTQKEKMQKKRALKHSKD